jgi:SH3-like domain-containing protein
MKASIVRQHRSNYPDAIRFKQGDTLTVGDLDAEYAGWIRARTKDGNTGWAPLDYLEILAGGELAIATMSYSAHELDVSPGDEVEVLTELNGWLWCSKSNGETGWIPADVVSSS